MCLSKMSDIYCDRHTKATNKVGFSLELEVDGRGASHVGGNLVQTPRISVGLGANVEDWYLQSINSPT